MMDISISPEYFERIYASDDDPWEYATSPYERRKYTATLAALPRRRFHCALEIGCSVGVLTRMLAARCDSLFALDICATPLVAARSHCRGMRHVRFRRMRVPAEWPNRTFDLIVLSEVLYYQSRRDQSATTRKISRSLRAQAMVVLVNWLGETGTARSGDTAAKQFIRETGRLLHVVRQTRNSRYRLDVLAR